MADVQRRLSAIVCADVVGYSRLMGADETGTLATLKAHRQVIDPVIAANGGRIVKTTGDGLLIEFPSVVDAVRAGLDVQRLMAGRNAEIAADLRMLLRIGVHLGDVIIDDEDIFGDGVNIAARLQEIAEPGGICLSQPVHDSVRGKLDASFHDGGAQSLKNIAEPVRVYHLALDAGAVRPYTAPETAGRRLSIVVLPFVNMSRDSEQEYFVDGVTESLTTELSRISGSFVISRNTAFAYKGKAVDAKQIGRELGVRYVLEGSVQAAGSRVRVNAQLIDAETGAHLWADRFDSQRGDLFDLQDEIVTRLARTLDVELTAAEAGWAERLRAQNPDSIDLTMRGWALLNRGRIPPNWRIAVGQFEQALSLDGNNVEALCGLSNAHGLLGFNWVTDQPAEHFQAAEAAALKALALAPNNPQAHVALGRVLLGTDRGEEALGEFRRALALDRNMAQVHGMISMSMRFLARPEESEEHALTAMRLSPRDVMLGSWNFQIGASALQLGQFDKAVTWLRRSMEATRADSYTNFFLASALAHEGLLDEARAAAAAGLAIDPDFKIRRMIDPSPSKKPKFLTQWEVVLDGMRKAGLPE
jgi:TolB-like protein/class 3 adenylate cyclase/tetratricopeptide (TPR) repeat protein